MQGQYFHSRFSYAKRKKGSIASISQWLYPEYHGLPFNLIKCYYFENLDTLLLVANDLQQVHLLSVTHNVTIL